MGIKIVLFLDDGIVTSKEKPTLDRQVNQIRYDLYKCGITVNEEKSSWNAAYSLLVGFLTGL